MSSITGQGRNTRKIVTIMAAVAAVAMMIAVPVFAAVDTDAELTKDEAGYRFDLTNPTDEQLSKVFINKSESISNSLWNDEKIINETILDVVKEKTDSYGYTGASGMKVTSDSGTVQFARIVEAKGYELRYNVTTDGYAFAGNASMSEKVKKAVTELNLYIGQVKAGDVLLLSGDIKSELATVATTEYTLQDDGTCVAKKSAASNYIVDSTELKIEVIRDNSVLKTVKYVSDVKGSSVVNVKFAYDESPVKIGTTYTETFDTSYTYSGDSYFVIDGKNYSVIGDEEKHPEQKGTVTSKDLREQSDISVASYKAIVASLPNESEEGMKVEKTYSAAESAVDGVILDAVGDELKLILIIIGIVIGIVVLVVILIVVLIVLKKKKK